MLSLYSYKVKEVVKVVDGDTVKLTLDLGFGLTKTDSYRLNGIDAPEIFRPGDEAEKEAGYNCKAYLEALLHGTEGRLYVKTSKLPEIYGRYGGTLYVQSMDLTAGLININDEMAKFISELS